MVEESIKEMTAEQIEQKINGLKKNQRDLIESCEAQLNERAVIIAMLDNELITRKYAH